jgi:hypothetical protein
MPVHEVAKAERGTAGFLPAVAAGAVFVSLLLASAGRSRGTERKLCGCGMPSRPRLP